MRLKLALKNVNFWLSSTSNIALLSKVMDTVTAEDFQVSVNIDEPRSVFPLALESFYVSLRFSTRGELKNLGCVGK